MKYNFSVILLLYALIITPLCSLAKEGGQKTAVDSLQNNTALMVSETPVDSLQNNTALMVSETPVDSLQNNTALMVSDSLLFFKNKNDSLQTKIKELSNEVEISKSKCLKAETDNANMAKELEATRFNVMSIAMYTLFMPSFDKGFHTQTIMPSISSLKESEPYKKYIDRMSIVENVIPDIEELISLLGETESEFSYPTDYLLTDSGKVFLEKLKATKCYIRYNVLPDWEDTFLGRKIVFLINEFKNPTKDESAKRFADLKAELQNLLK